MDCVILFRNTGNDRVGFIGDGDEIAVFKDMDEAIAWSSQSKLCGAFPYQIVELDEL